MKFDEATKLFFSVFDLLCSCMLRQDPSSMNEVLMAIICWVFASSFVCVIDLSRWETHLLRLMIWGERSLSGAGIFEQNALGLLVMRFTAATLCPGTDCRNLGVFDKIGFKALRFSLDFTRNRV